MSVQLLTDIILPCKLGHFSGMNGYPSYRLWKIRSVSDSFQNICVSIAWRETKPCRTSYKDFCFWCPVACPAHSSWRFLSSNYTSKLSWAIFCGFAYQGLQHKSSWVPQPCFSHSLTSASRRGLGKNPAAQRKTEQNPESLHLLPCQNFSESWISHQQGKIQSFCLKTRSGLVANLI